MLQKPQMFILRTFQSWVDRESNALYVWSPDNSFKHATAAQRRSLLFWIANIFPPRLTFISDIFSSPFQHTVYDRCPAEVKVVWNTLSCVKNEYESPYKASVTDIQAWFRRYTKMRAPEWNTDLYHFKFLYLLTLKPTKELSHPTLMCVPACVCVCVI